MTLKELKGIIPDNTVLTLKDAQNKKGEALGTLKINAFAIGCKSEFADWKVICFRPETLEVFIYNEER